jgi:predicted DNA-binding transcriptional regulator YafY
VASNAVDRTARALDLIPYILDRPGISVEELAQAFRTTPAEISETLNIVFMCGLPGYTPLELVDLNTDGGEVSIIDPQNLNKPRRLSQIEIISIILGIENLKSQGLSGPVSIIANSLISKMTALLDDIRALQILESSKNVESSVWREPIEKAIREKCVLEIDYAGISNDEMIVRKISPSRLYTQNGQLYVEAISQDSGELRNFRLDRISKVTDIGKSSTPDIRQDQGVAADIEVQVLIPKKDVLFLERNQNIIESSEIIGDMRKVHFRVSQTNWLRRALASIDGDVVVLHPDSFAREFRTLAQISLNGYKMS